MDREELVLRAGLVLRGMFDLMHRAGGNREEWDRILPQLHLLNLKWRLLMEQLHGREYAT